MKITDLKTKPKIFAGVCAPLGLLAILSTISIVSINNILDSNRSVEHTHEVLANADSIVGSAVDMEAARDTKEQERLKQEEVVRKADQERQQALLDTAQSFGKSVKTMIDLVATASPKRSLATFMKWQKEPDW